VALIIMWLVGYGSLAFETVLWPVLGFIFLPYTTCAYAFAMNEVGAIRGAGLLFVIIGVILDIGSHSGGGASGYRHVTVHHRVRR
jgi:hypothetical protein